MIDIRIYDIKTDTWYRWYTNCTTPNNIIISLSGVFCGYKLSSMIRTCYCKNLIHIHGNNKIYIFDMKR